MDIRTGCICTGRIMCCVSNVFWKKYWKKGKIGTAPLANQKCVMYRLIMKLYLNNDCVSFCLSLHNNMYKYYLKMLAKKYINFILTHSTTILSFLFNIFSKIHMMRRCICTRALYPHNTSIFLIIFSYLFQHIYKGFHKNPILQMDMLNAFFGHF